MGISERIQQIIKENNLSNRSFSKRINCADTTIGNIISGKSEPGYKLLFAILDSFSEIDPDWLMTGKGSMKRQNNEIQHDDLEILTEVISSQKQEISDLKAQLREKDKQLGELIKTNLMLLEREEHSTSRKRLKRFTCRIIT